MQRLGGGRPTRRKAAIQRGAGQSLGQSVVEFALVVPFLLLILLFAIDFGRAFFGYVILNNASRIAANYAALYPGADWASPSDPNRLQYEQLIQRDTNVANCAVASIPQPVYTDGPDSASPDTSKDVGDFVRVDIQCTFQPLTPIIGSVVGSSLTMGASSEFTVRAGNVTGVPDPTAVPPPSSPPPPPCAAGEATVPDLVNPSPETVSQARAEWSAAGFMGSFSPNGQNTKIVQSQSLPAGSCQPTGSSITVTHT